MRQRREPFLQFLSDNIYSDPQYAKELFRQLKSLAISWDAATSIDIAFDDEALHLAKASGCKALLIGFETINPRNYKKTSLSQIQTIKDYKIAINNIRAYGIKVVGTFIVGLDEYSHLDYWRLLWFIMRSRLWYANLSLLTPFPDTALFERLKKEDRILSFDWRKYNFFFCVIRPKHTSAIGVTVWFWLIRYLSVFFSPMLSRFLLIYIISYILYQMAWGAGNSLVHHWIISRF